MLNENRKLRLCSYARVSAVRGREGPGFISERDQHARNRAYAEAYGHSIVAEDSDLDVSGGKMSRPVFDRFMEMIERGEADGLIVAKLDRFARSNVGALKAVEAMEEHGAVLISVAEQIDPTTGAGKFLRSILFAAAEWEKDRIGDQWITARTSSVERGIHVSHNVPPGYQRLPKSADPATDRRLLPHPVHAETVREAFGMAAQGKSNAEIARYLNECQLPITSIKRGERPILWRPGRIDRLLGDRVYLGEARSGKGIVNSHAHEPLVDDATFLLAQHRSRRPELRRPNRKRDEPSPYFLTGMVRCSGCSYAMATGPKLYRCVKLRTYEHYVCPEPSAVAKDRIESYVLDEFVTHYADKFELVTEQRLPENGPYRLLLEQATAAERSYRAALVNVELRRTIGDTDHDAMVESLYRDWQAKLAEAEAARPPQPLPTVIPAGMNLAEFVDACLNPSAYAFLPPPVTRGLTYRVPPEQPPSLGLLRDLLHEGIVAIFVRKAASSSPKAPVADRVKLVWRGEPEPELPRRGVKFEPRPYRW